jgi:hypothetical protein
MKIRSARGDTISNFCSHVLISKTFNNKILMHCFDILPWGLLIYQGPSLGRKHPRVPEGFATLPGVLIKSSKIGKWATLRYLP